MGTLGMPTMDFNKTLNTLLFSIFILSASLTAHADNSDDINLIGLSFNEMAKRVKRKYINNNASSFDNFHEEFILVRSMGFPHIKEGFFHDSLDEDLVQNPQAIFAFEKRHNQKDEEFRTSSIENIDKAHKEYRLKTANQKNTKDIESQINNYAKSGYYRYFKNILTAKQNSNETRPTANVCIGLDLEALGFEAIWISSGENYEQEKALREQDITNAIKSHFPNGEYDNISISDYCSIRLDVTQIGLDYMNESAFVTGIYHPGLYSHTNRYLKAL